MPGFDRTGPMGQGPMSGGGFGQCGGARRASAGSGYGMGRGRGRGRRFAGQAGSDGAGRRQSGSAAPYDEVNDLKAITAELKADLLAVEARLDALGKENS